METAPAKNALDQARDTLAQIDRLTAARDARDAAAKEEREAPFAAVQYAKDKIASARQASKIFNAAAKALESAAHYTGPVGRAALTIGSWLKSAFMYAAFERDGKGNFKLDADGDKIFAPHRLARSFLLAAMIGTSAIVGGQYAYFHGTHFEQTIYTTGKDPIETGELYEFTGCTSLPCSTKLDNSQFYHIRHSLYAPRLIYPEDDVYAPIPKSDGVCEVKGYGLYIKELKFLHKYFEFYPNIYEATCRPYTQAEKDHAIESGEILHSPMLHDGTHMQLHIPAP